jgi:hypothetical protein
MILIEQGGGFFCTARPLPRSIWPMRSKSHHSLSAISASDKATPDQVRDDIEQAMY